MNQPPDLLLWLLLSSLGITLVIQHSPLQLGGGRWTRAAKALGLGVVCALLLYRVLSWVLW